MRVRGRAVLQTKGLMMPTNRLIACPAEHVGIRFYDAPRLRAKGRGGALRGRRWWRSSARVAGL